MRCFRIAAALFLLAGCEVAMPERLPGIAKLRPTQADLRDEESYRVKFQTEADPKALDWLMANCLDSGMAVDDVNEILGTEGERVENDDWIKNHSGRYRADDETWRWGPDSNGRSIYLVFRERSLIFNPSEHRAKMEAAAE